MIPVLKEINPSIEQTLNEAAERFSGFNEIVTEYIATFKGKHYRGKRSTHNIQYQPVKDHLHNKVVLFEFFRPFSITSALLTDLIKVIKGKTGGQIITDSHRIIKEQE